MLLLLASASALAGPHTAMVGFTVPQDIAGIGREAAVHGAVVQRCFQRARFCVLEFPGAPALSGFPGLQGVRYAEPDQRIDLGQQGDWPDASGTADCSDLWDLEFIGAEEAWEIADGTDGPVVAIADSGFLQSHEELTDKVSGQWDYGDGDSYANLEWSAGVPAHGTFIGAIIAGVGDNGAGRSGVAPGAQLNLLKIADSDGALYYSYAASALADVADGDLGIRSVNYSIASSSYTTSFRDAVLALADVDVVLVAAAGNCSSAHCSDADNDRYPLYPSSFSYDHVISVAGATTDGGRNSYSHYGASSVDLAAPGVSICSAGVDSDDDYYSAAGTSYAAPMVAATVSLLLEAHPDLTMLELARVLRASAIRDSEWTGKVRSGGVLSAIGALQTAVPRLDPPDDSVVVDEDATLRVSMENPGAVGDAAVLFAHGDGVAVDAATTSWHGAWTVEPYAPGDTVSLPDVGDVVMTGSGSVLRGELDAHASVDLYIDLSGVARGVHAGSLRLVVSSEGADYLNAPYDEGDDDETGYLAFPVELDVVAVAPLDSGTDGGADSGGTDGGTDGDTDDGADSGGADGGTDGSTGDGGTDGGTTDGGATDSGGGDDGGKGDDDEAPKGGCATAPLTGGLFLTLLAVAGRRRR
ncbi:MAG: S8 family serine peptidase [Alphaproteobacteria bacterium]|nr:S8 family serine peptidase [Alphaproteobacteria bacterium]